MTLRKYQICTNCVMDTTDSNIKFDSDGVCDHCIDFKKNVHPFWNGGNNKKDELKKQDIRLVVSGTEEGVSDKLTKKIKETYKRGKKPLIMMYKILITTMTKKFCKTSSNNCNRFLFVC